MSVIITNMSMPDSCKECELTYVDMCGEDCCCILGDDISTKDRLKNCPLKSVDGFGLVANITKEYCEVEE